MATGSHLIWTQFRNASADKNMQMKARLESHTQGLYQFGGFKIPGVTSSRTKKYSQSHQPKLWPLKV